MSKSPKRKTRRTRQQAKAPSSRRDPRIIRRSGPASRLPQFFEVLDDLTRTSDLALFQGHDVEDRLAQFDWAVFVRGVNLLKASRGLLADGHWEVAASAARQLFELVVNMEHINRQPSREEACFRYQKFALRQYALRCAREMDYDRATGRPVDETKATFVAALLDSPSFEEFRGAKGKGWRRSWSGHDTKYLAEQSQSQMRKHQYAQLFTTWSEETHGAPVALLDGMIPESGANWVEETMASDDRETGQMILMLVALFWELFRNLPHGPRIEIEKQRQWIDALVESAT